MTVHCYCGKVAQVKTSKTPQNPGRRFLTCPEQIQCGFFLWEDMYLWITKGGNVNRGSKRQVWWVVVVAIVVILFFILKSSNEEDGIGNEICKCGCSK